MNDSKYASQEQIISDFIDKLLEEKGLMNLDLETKEEMKKDLFERIEDNLNAAILENIPPEKLGDFEQLLDPGTDDEVQNFCLTAIPDFETVIAGELLKFKQIYLSE